MLGLANMNLIEIEVTSESLGNDLARQWSEGKNLAGKSANLPKQYFTVIKVLGKIILTNKYDPRVHANLTKEQ